ncbi:MAG: hypothetical protein WCX61_03070 [Candidatus Peribacteraceae bacterium]|jgi:hypothetical protein
MINTLFLTDQEHVLFDALPAKLKEGWQVESETQVFNDTPRHAYVRLSLLTINDPKILAFIERAQATTSIDDLAALILDTDLSGVSERAIAKLFFALGPAPLAKIVPVMLAAAKKDRSLEEVAAVTTVRHTVLSSLKHSSQIA